MYHILLICSSVSEHLGCFYLSAIVNTAAINMVVQVSLQDSAFSYFVYIPRMICIFLMIGGTEHLFIG